MKKVLFIILLAVPGYFLYNYLESAKYDTLALNALQIAINGQTGCMQLQGEYCESEAIVIRHADNWNPGPDLVFTILQADAGNYIMEMYHVNGTKIYTATLDVSYKPQISDRAKQMDL